jgi:hypothetical protein
MGDRTEVAISAAPVPENEESGCSSVPAFDRVRAVRLLAHGVEAQIEKESLEKEKILAQPEPYAQPRRFRLHAHFLLQA